MQIYPAIDLYQGQCVRLYQGDYLQQTRYSNTPEVMAKQFIDAGATWLHIVDLSGAKAPEKHQRSLIGQLAKQLPVAIQTGGGIREEQAITNLLSQGVQRIIIGSLAVTDVSLVCEWIKKFGSQHIALAFDCEVDEYLQAKIKIHGWQHQSAVFLDDMLCLYQQVGIKHVICTDIGRDGTLAGPNQPLYSRLIAKFPQLVFQASGGIKDIQDVQALAAIKMPGLIIGKALYENHIQLTQLFENSHVS